MEKEPSLYIQKIALLDKLFNSCSIDDIKAIAGESLTMSTLKGDILQDGPFSRNVQLVSDNITLRNDVAYLRSEMMGLKTELHSLIRVLNQPQFNSSTAADFNAIKIRNGIY
jgi:hypothetical protein